MHNFDQITDRRATSSTKWDRYANQDILPFWVADMDFQAPAFITAAVKARVDHGIFGYTQIPTALTDAFIEYLHKEFNWTVDAAWLVWLPGVVPGVNLAAKATTPQASDSILIPIPVYYPFLNVPDNVNRAGILAPLKTADDQWAMDFSHMANLVDANTRLLLLSNPQNPTGRAYRGDELEDLANFCVEKNIVVCSDEIHCDLILDNASHHTPIASLNDNIANLSISLFAATKTYNIPGLSCAVAVIPNPILRLQFIQAQADLVQSPGPLSLVASQAAYEHDGSWREALKSYLRGNLDFLYGALDNLPGVTVTRLEATYLAWIDVRNLNLSNPQRHFEKYGIGLSPGDLFGGPGFVRLNFGCPRQQLEEGLSRFIASYKKADGKTQSGARRG